MDDIDSNPVDNRSELNDEGLIPIDNSLLSPDIIEAGRRADEELAAQESRLNTRIEEMEMNSNLTTETGSDTQPPPGSPTRDSEESITQNQPSDTLIQSPLDSDTISNPPPIQSERYATTELGNAVLVEAGPESPERIIYNNLENETEENSNPEILG